MEAFRWTSTVLSMLLGLGVARILSSAVSVFRSRAHSEIDWIPCLWALAIFLFQLQFWWALVELPAHIRHWPLGDFLLLVLLTLTLFVAAALVLPMERLAPGESLAHSFEQDGRWALAFLSAYCLLSCAANWLLWHEPPVHLASALNLVLASVPWLYIAARTRRARSAVTVGFLFLTAVTTWLLSPHSY